MPVLIANGDNDIMVPTIHSVALFRALPNAELSIFPNAGHGGIFQYHGNSPNRRFDSSKTDPIG
jgi:pimeloyl-ACP methyl ester carboxylesterase